MQLPTEAHQLMAEFGPVLLKNASLISNYLGKLILEQPWNLAEGTGEICLQDNRQLLHASYDRNASQNGYRIGVRYLA